MSASLKPIAWCSPIGLPKATRSREYASAASYAARARPTESAAVMIRISARMPPIFSAPPCSPPSRYACGTSTSSRRISPVAEARTAILSIGLPSVMPRIVRRSSRKSAMFFIPRSPDVFAATVSTSATGALVTHVLVPRSTQRSPRRSARVARLATSEPALGSVIANVATSSPRSAGTR